jgi:hypothetical protein
MARSSSTLLGRMVRRFWAPILGLWVLTTLTLMAMAYTGINASYTATALLIVRSMTPSVFDMRAALANFGKLVTSPNVLVDTLAAHRELVASEALQGSSRRNAEMRRLLEVEIRFRRETNLVSVSMTAADRKEAVSLVETMAGAYLKIGNRWSAEESQTNIERLQVEENELKNEIARKRASLRNLVERLGAADASSLSDQGRVRLDRYNSYLSRLENVRRDRIKAESALEAAQLMVGRGGKASKEIEDHLAKLEAKAATAQTLECKVAEDLRTLELENTEPGGESLEALFAMAELDQDERLLMEIQGQIRQFEFDFCGPSMVERANHRVRVDPGPNKQMSAQKITALALSPLGALLLVWPLFLAMQWHIDQTISQQTTTPEDPPGPA